MVFLVSVVPELAERAAAAPWLHPLVSHPRTKQPLIPLILKSDDI